MKFAVLALAGVPALVFAYRVWLELTLPGAGFGVDGADAATGFLGEWALRLLLVTLSVSTLRRRLGVSTFASSRRGLGLWTFAYASGHFVIYLVALAGLSFAQVLEDVVERPYITVGFLALLILLPLAVTSTRGWQRRLGRRWSNLHKAAYLAAALALLHLFWLTRDGFAEVLIYVAWFAVLMADRFRQAAARRSIRTSARS
ncbi:MAG: ferric reductase-like transmembrane domain-containing protein [Pseudomonadaceae bacterium]|nr:ferric reductase-like transmembrane domain-containing protein [Pseudomonadaceae bacterium]